MTQQAVDLQIAGMTCASCTARIEKLNRMPGVETSVNYATDKAHVLPEGTAVEAAIATVEATGYTASLPIGTMLPPRKRSPRKSPSTPPASSPRCCPPTKSPMSPNCRATAGSPNHTPVTVAATG